MTIWTVLFRTGKRRRARYLETQVYARDQQEAIEVATRSYGPRRAVVVSAREVEG